MPKATTMNTTPKISIVVTSRNDNYSGNLLNRMNTSLKALIGLTNKFKANFELIIVEYNPPENKKHLRDELKIKNNKFLSVRFITVPKTFHKKFVNNDKIPLLEWVAKNIGARRAKGEFILCTNVDIIFSAELVKFLTINKLKKNVFYRINRSDIAVKRFNENLSVDKILTACKHSEYRKLTTNSCQITNFFSFYGLKTAAISISYFIFLILKINSERFLTFIANKPKDHLFTFGDLNNRPYHHAAAGDFLLMHKNIWRKVHGYDETPVSGYMDVKILYVAGCYGFKQEILPFDIYHIEHSWGRIGRPTLELAEFNRKCKKMFKTNVPDKLNSTSWGAKKYKFSEIVNKANR